MKKIISFLLFLVINSTVFAQFSKTHYIPPIASSESSGAAIESQYLYISTPSVTPVHFKIIELGGSTILGTVSRSVPYEYFVGNGENTQLNLDNNSINTVTSDKGYIIEAEEDVIYVTARVNAGDDNQAGELVSKGIAALGKRFRIGGFLNTLVPGYGASHLTFISVLATENNTTVEFSDIHAGAVLMNNPGAFNTPAPVVLNRGQSFVIAVQGPTEANREALIGSLVTSDKPIVVNCGSFDGSNGEMNNQDTGFDQIVSAERTGTEYIFIKSTGTNNVERVLLIADEDDTDFYLNGNTTGVPNFSLNAGEYIALTGTYYNSNGNLYVKSNKNIFAYQSIGDNVLTSQANQEMFFVPPLNCKTPKIIDNIPFLNKIGPKTFSGRVTIVTQTGSPLNFLINETPYTLAALTALSGISVTGPTMVVGNTNYETYTIIGLSGNVSVYSTGQLYLASYGSSGAATFGGFYSGFTFNPEITLNKIVSNQSNCIPNVNLTLSTLSGFDTFQWYFNGAAIPAPAGTSNSYLPLQPGYYYLSASLAACGVTDFLDSVLIPVSDCPADTDNDQVNNNIDLDLDNDGLTNCMESFGDLPINVSNAAGGTITVGNYSNSFTGIITTAGPSAPAPIPFVGNSNGSFVSEVPLEKGNSMTYQMNFNQPVSISLEYVATASVSNLINSNADFVVKCPINKTITLSNPTNQLLVDTNYDGIFESGVTQFSSFEIRFRLNSVTPLAAGSGTFSFRSELINSFSIIHTNLSDLLANKATFSIIATCVPKDNDLDGIYDQFDADSDGDGISDNIELTSQNYIAPSNVDANSNGIDDIYETGIIASDFDLDGVPDYYDLDSDNDGIKDSIETGANSDGTGIANYVDLDSDGDGCSDVIEAGFLDGNNDSFLGGLPLTVSTTGLVTSGIGYTTPNANYSISAPITIITQPTNQTTCEFQNATISVVTTPIDIIQWQVSTDGITWTNIVDNATYSGSNTNSIQISGVTTPLTLNKYRAVLSKNGNSCGLISDVAMLSTFALPTVVPLITMKQCDDDTDGISIFNLTQKNDFISPINYLTETFTYFTTPLGAASNDLTVQIINPIAFLTSNASVWVRIVNQNGCASVSRINLIVSVSQINAATFQRSFTVCDDYLDAINNDTDGISTFDFSSVTADIQSYFSVPASSYTIKYYENENDALSEINEITIPSNYRNSTPNQQLIYVRIDSTLDNECYGLDPLITLTVEALPVAHVLPSFKICDTNNDGIYTFDTANLESDLLNGQTNVIVAYSDFSGNPLLDINGNIITSPFPNTFTTTTQTIKIKLTNTITNTTNGTPCFDETTISFEVYNSPTAFPIPATAIITVCDDQANIDGTFDFDTSGFDTAILNGQPNMVVNYFDENNNPIMLTNPFNTSTQNILAVVTNSLYPTCSDQVIIPFKVFPTPNFNLIGNNLICLNYASNYTTLSAELVDGLTLIPFTYVWKRDNAIISGANLPFIDTNIPGDYELTATNEFGCSATQNMTVTSSEIAVLDLPTVVDLGDINSITVNVASGIGDYVYSIDNENGPYQTSNFFGYIYPGIHEIYVKDMKLCGIAHQSVAVVGVPHFFTPNGDGINDTWTIFGVNSKFNSNAKIYVFDRYGKLLKNIQPDGQGWDGTFDNQPVTSDDYWYVLYLEDGRTAKGHFALKR
jgi:gliding motility-associated-like protein